MDELEWVREDKKLSADDRDRAVNELIELVLALDAILQAQAGHDAEYFVANCQRALSSDERQSIGRTMLKAYRWQYIISGVKVPRFGKVLTSLISSDFSSTGLVLEGLLSGLAEAESGSRR